MKHTRILQTTVTLAALVVGSACSATTATQPATTPSAIRTVAVRSADAPDIAPVQTPDVHVDVPASVEVPATVETPPNVETPVIVEAPPNPAPDPEPAPTTQSEPAAEPASEPAAAPVFEPVVESNDAFFPLEPQLAQIDTKVDTKVDTKRPTPPVRRPDLDLAFAPCGTFGPLADSASAVSTVMVDAVGDGTADDAFSGYLDGGDWALRLTTSDGTISEYDVAGVGPGFVEALGAAQFDAAPGDQFLAVVGSGPSNLRIGAFGADAKGCIVRFTDTGGTDVELQVGGTIGQLNGVACSEWNGMSYVESLGATDMGGGSYNVYGTSWHKVGVNELESENGTHLFGVSFEEAEVIAQLDCPGITL